MSDYSTYNRITAQPKNFPYFVFIFCVAVMLQCMKITLGHFLSLQMWWTKRLLTCDCQSQEENSVHILHLYIYIKLQRQYHQAQPYIYLHIPHIWQSPIHYYRKASKTHLNKRAPLPRLLTSVGRISANTLCTVICMNSQDLKLRLSWCTNWIYNIYDSILQSRVILVIIVFSSI